MPLLSQQIKYRLKHGFYAEDIDTLKHTCDCDCGCGKTFESLLTTKHQLL